METEIVNAYPVLSLAYLGDAVFEREIRIRLLQKGGSRPSILNRRGASVCNAAAQAKIADRIRDLFTTEEAAVFQRGRNASPKTMAKNQSMSDYRKATGLEAVFGYLALLQKEERIRELIEYGLCGYSYDREFS